MSSSAIAGVGGTVLAPLNPISASPQAAAQPQAAQAINGVQPILLVPTKPPLSAAVMAELLGQQPAPYGGSIGDYPKDQKPTDATSGTSLEVRSSGLS